MPTREIAGALILNSAVPPQCGQGIVSVLLAELTWISSMTTRQDSFTHWYSYVIVYG